MASENVNASWNRPHIINFIIRKHLVINALHRINYPGKILEGNLPL